MSNHEANRKHLLFVWKARNKQGLQVQGRIQTATADLARAQLRRQGWDQIHLQRLWWDKPASIRPKELSTMTRQLAALLRAGMPLLQALNMLSRNTAAKSLTAVLQVIHQDVEAGLSLHAAMAKHPQHFRGLYVHMVQAGESAGILEAMMERLSLTLEKNEALRSKVHSALMYPSAVLTVAAGILIMVLTWVVPVFQEVFQSMGAELPWPTQAVVLASDTLVRVGPWLLLATLPLAWWLGQPRPSVHRIRQWSARWFLHWPVLGPIMTTSVVSRWAQTLSALLSAGVPLTEALGPTAQACDHSVFERHTLNAQRRVMQGSSLSEALRLSGRFPELLVQLCATGEETGALDTLLGRAAHLMETDIDDQISGLSSLLEPLIIVVLGLFIGGILVAMYLPIFNMGQAF